MAAISYVHHLNGWGDPDNIFASNSMLKGYRKLYQKPDSKRAITVDMLRSISSHLHTVCRNTFEATLHRAALLVAYFGFLRSSEFTAATKFSEPPLLLSDLLVCSGDSFTLVIKKSKTDQLQKGVHLSIERAGEPLICPLRALQSYMQLRSGLTQQALFVHEDHTPLTTFQFSYILKRAAAAAGIPLSGISCHSLRIGACSMAKARGHSDTDLKKFGRWRSTAYKSYIRIPTTTIITGLRNHQAS